MKKFNYCLALIAALAITIISCDNEPDPIIAPVVSSIIANGTSFEDGSSVSSDLNGAASASDVPLDATITVTLDKAIDAATVNVSNVAISEGTNDVASSVSASGSSITIDPNDEFIRGTQYTLTISGVKSSDGGDLATVTRTFTTEGRAPVVVPKVEDQIAYWNFDGQMMDQAGSFNPDNSVAIEFGTDRFGQGNSTATFDGDESIIEIPNGDQLMANNDFTLSFWMKTNNTDHVNQNGDPSSHFVMGLGAFLGFQFEVPANFESCKLAMSYAIDGGDPASEDLWFPGNGMDGNNGGWQGWDFVADLTGAGGVASLIKDRWVHILCTYDATEKKGQMYIDGELMKSQDFDLWPEEAPKRNVTGVTYRGMEPDVEPILAIGFIKSIDSQMWADTPWGDYAKPTSNHFKGDLDDIRIWKTSLSADDVATLYNSEK